MKVKELLTEAKKPTPLHLLPTGGKASKHKGLVDLKASMDAIGGTRKQKGDDGKTYFTKGGKVVGVWDSIAETGVSYAAADGPVGVPNPSDSTKKSRKAGQAAVATAREHIRTSGYNTSYAKKNPRQVKEAHITESATEDEIQEFLVAAIRDDWMNWSVERIVRMAKLCIKDGDKGWEILKGYSDDDLYDLIDSAKDEARNQFESLNEGKFIVKSKDGVEKRFSNASSPEAKAWKTSVAKKAAPKVEKYSDEYWEKKADEPNVVTPRSKIGAVYDDSIKIERAIKDQLGTAKTDWTIGKKGETKRDGTTCATAVIRVMFEYGPEDDMGVDEPTSDTQSILVARNPKNPKSIDFLKYV